MFPSIVVKLSDVQKLSTPHTPIDIRNRDLNLSTKKKKVKLTHQSSPLSMRIGLVNSSLSQLQPWYFHHDMGGHLDGHSRNKSQDCRCERDYEAHLM